MMYDRLDYPARCRDSQRCGGVFSRALREKKKKVDSGPTESTPLFTIILQSANRLLDGFYGKWARVRELC